MSLRWVEIENYRGIARGRVTFDDVTVIFGENDSGRSSVIEVLALSLDPGHAAASSRLRPYQFHRTPDGRTGGMRLAFGLHEDQPGSWRPPARVVAAFPSDGATRSLDVEIRARLRGASGRISVVHLIRSDAHPGVRLEGAADTRDWLRSLMPVLRLRPGQLTDPDGIGDLSALADDPEDDTRDLLRALALHHRNLLAGDVPDLQAELDAGARVAQAVVERFGRVFADGGPAMSAMAMDVLAHGPAATGRRGRAVPVATGAHKLAVLLLLGAMIELARRVALSGPLAPGARPILVIDNPEVNLHPTTLASVWGIVERISWQRIVTTNAEAIVAAAPVTSLRRLTRHGGRLREWRVAPDALSGEALRKVSYHLRSRRASAVFARAWILAEGETEYWVLPELARVLGYDLAAEGVACVEFAQCGVVPLLQLADQLGIATTVLVDGDDAGRHYARAVRDVDAARHRRRTVLRLRERDIEHSFWAHGFADVIGAIAHPAGPPGPMTAGRTIRKAIERTSKPHLALSLIEAVVARGPASVPAPLRTIIERSVGLARA